MTQHAAQHTREKHLMTLLARVIDPELHIPITEMGLIYGAELDANNTAVITMTLTTIGCPLFDAIKQDIEDVLLADKQIKKVVIDLTFDPPWHPGMMSKEQQLEMGII